MCLRSKLFAFMETLVINLIDWLVHWLIDRSTDRSTDWLIDYDVYLSFVFQESTMAVVESRVASVIRASAVRRASAASPVRDPRLTREGSRAESPTASARTANADLPAPATRSFTRRAPVGVFHCGGLYQFLTWFSCACITFGKVFFSILFFHIKNIQIHSRFSLHNQHGWLGHSTAGVFVVQCYFSTS